MPEFFQQRDMLAHWLMVEHKGRYVPLSSMTELTIIRRSHSPVVTVARLCVSALIAGHQATRCYLEFFATAIRNPNSRMVYYRTVVRLSPGATTTSWGNWSPSRR